MRETGETAFRVSLHYRVSENSLPIKQSKKEKKKKASQLHFYVPILFLTFSLLPHCPPSKDLPPVLPGCFSPNCPYVQKPSLAKTHLLLPPVPGGGHAEGAVIAHCRSSSQEHRAGRAAKRKRKKSKVMTSSRLLFHPGVMAWLDSMPSH